MFCIILHYTNIVLERFIFYYTTVILYEYYTSISIERCHGGGCTFDRVAPIAPAAGRTGERGCG